MKFIKSCFKKIGNGFKNVFSHIKNIKKSTWSTVVSNLIIAICIFTAFNSCFSLQTTTASAGNINAIYRGNVNNKNASLMINVYWGTEYIEPMLEILKQNDIKTTFFVGGYWVAQNEDLLKKIIADGHEIANHGYYHKNQGECGLERNKEEISMNHQLVKSLTGVEMNLFAPPSGSFNAFTLQASEQLGYKTIMWSKDTIDWRDKNTELIKNRATKNIQNGDLILMHPIKCTVEALPDIILAYKQAGMNLTTVTNTIS